MLNRKSYILGLVLILLVGCQTFDQQITLTALVTSGDNQLSTVSATVITTLPTSTSTSEPTFKPRPTNSPTPIPSPALTQTLTVQPTLVSLPTPKSGMKAADYIDEGIAHYDQNDLVASLQAFDLAIVLDPWLIEAYEYRHAIRLELEQSPPLDQLDAEIVSYNRAISDNPDIAEAYYNRGRAKYIRTLLSGKPKIVRDLAAELNDLENITVSGQMITVKLNLEDSISDFNQAIKLDPEYACAYHMRGLAYHLQSLEYYNIAVTELDHESLEQAIQDYNQAIQLNSEFSEAFHDRGTAFLQRGWFTLRETQGIPEGALGDVNKSLEDFTNAIELNPNSQLTYLNRAFAYVVLMYHLDEYQLEQRNLLNNCVDDTRMLIDLDPANMWGYLIKSWAYHRVVEMNGESEAFLELEDEVDADLEIYEELSKELRSQYALEDLTTRVPTLSMGPPTNPIIADLGLSGTIDDGYYSHPDELFQLKVPELMDPENLIWDEFSASGNQVVYFSDALGRMFALLVHPCAIADQTLDQFVQVNLLQPRDGREMFTVDTEYGDAFGFLYEDIDYNASCGMAVIHNNNVFYTSIYCLINEAGDGTGEEFGYRDLADLYGIPYESVKELTIVFLEGLEIPSR